MPFKIQIVEDDRGTVAFLSKKLSEAGFEVSACSDGKLAIDEIQRFKPDLVLLDFNLPSADGLWVVTTLRNAGNQVPVTIISSGVDQQQKDKLRAQGISGYWEKPFNINSLIVEIGKITQSRAKKPSAQKTVLIVDDSQDTLDFIKEGLTAEGYHSIVASDGRAVLQAIHIHDPNLIILDLNMPELNGWRFSQILRQDEKFAKYRQAPIVLVSPLVAQEGPASDATPKDYLMPKPFDLNNLLSKIKTLLVEQA